MLSTSYSTANPYLQKLEYRGYHDVIILLPCIIETQYQHMTEREREGETDMLIIAIVQHSA